MIKRGFELLRTRSLDARPNIGRLEEEYNIKIPPLYTLFLKTFEIGENLISTDKFYIEKYQDTFECTYYYTELDKEGVMFKDFLSIEKSLHIRESMYDKHDEVITKGYLPIGQTAFNATIHLGTQGDETDELILETDKRVKFKRLNVNIFQFVQSIVLANVEDELMTDGIKHAQLFKNWDENFWRVKA